MSERIRASVVVVFQGNLLCVKLEDPLTKVIRFFPPGGKVEANESPIQAAVRETKEETGFVVELDPRSELVKHYPFVWNGKHYDCSTYYYKGSLVSDVPTQVEDASYHRGVEWVPLVNLERLFSYDETIRTAILELAT